MVSLRRGHGRELGTWIVALTAVTVFASACGSQAPQGKNGNAWTAQTQQQAVELAMKNLTAADRKNVCAVFRTDPDRVWAGFSTEHSDNQDGWVTRKNYDEAMKRMCK